MKPHTHKNERHTQHSSIYILVYTPVVVVVVAQGSEPSASVRSRSVRSLEVKQPRKNLLNSLKSP